MHVLLCWFVYLLSLSLHSTHQPRQQSIPLAQAVTRGRSPASGNGSGGSHQLCQLLIICFPFFSFFICFLLFFFFLLLPMPFLSIPFLLFSFYPLPFFARSSLCCCMTAHRINCLLSYFLSRGLCHYFSFVFFSWSIDTLS